MNWDQQLQAIRDLASKRLREWSEFAAEVGPVHVTLDVANETGGHVVICNGRFSGSCFVGILGGEVEDEAMDGGNASEALREMVEKPWHRGPPCGKCPS